ncbi:MAG: Na/Pi symporter [Arcobacteraceae bacterium]|jgi:phosphate:Na+ symporter|nr:Na/Pi symporter [Arcobacteraceae bacterium]
MIKKSLVYLLLGGLAYLLFVSQDSKYIVAGVGIFIIGMHFMEDGFKLFSGGMLEKVIAKTTDTIPKSISLGVIATAILQSSSLIAIIIISFLSAKLITLSSAIGVTFGSNLGTTATAWIVSYFGLKIDIAAFALPMVIFGVIFRFFENKSTKGMGNILLGLGFVFLGIGYMKDGFEDLKEGIDLSQFAVEGYLGVLIYIAIGIIATMILQSSSAMLALTITALATGQIMYLNAIALAIGANIGTTITAAMGAMVSNANSKRLAVGLVMFNTVTAFAVVFVLYYFVDFVDMMAGYVGISPDDYAMKLSLFHTFFNLFGLVIWAFFIPRLVTYLKTLFVEDMETYISKPRYLNMDVVEVPSAAFEATKKEVIHLYENATEVLSHAIMLHRHRYLGQHNIDNIVRESTDIIELDIDNFYQTRIKSLYSDIVDYSTFFVSKLTDDKKSYIIGLRGACRDIAEAVKDTKELQKNIAKYLQSNNDYIKEEYNLLRISIAKTMDVINQIKNSHDELDVLAKSKVLQDYLKNMDVITSGRIDALIRENKIDKKMATTLLNDSSNAYNVTNKLINVAKILWIEDVTIKKIGEQL